MAQSIPPPPGMEDTLPQISGPLGAPVHIPPPPGLEPEQPVEAQPAEQAQAPQQQQLPWGDITRTAADFASGPAGWAKQTYQAGSEYLRHQSTPRAAFAKGAKDILTGNLLPADEQYEKQLMAEHPYAETAGKAAGLGTMMIPGAGTPSTFAQFGLKGRLAWQALVGGGLGAWTGASTGEGFQDRYQRAKTDAVIGGSLGAIGGILGEATGALINKTIGPRVSGTTKYIAKKLGLSPEEPAAAQQDEIREMLAKRFPEPETGQLQNIPGILSRHARGMEDEALKALQLAGSKGASLSADAVRGMKQHVAQDLKRMGINVEKGIGMSPKGQQALNILNNLEEEAAQNGNASMQSIMDMHKNINRLWGADEDVVHSVQHAYDKFIRNAADAHLFAGDESAVQDWYRYRKLYSGFKEFIDPHNAFGNVIEKGLNADQIGNWLRAADDVKGDAAATLARGLKGYLGEASPEFAAIRDNMTAKALNISPDKPLKPNSLVDGFNKILKSQVARELYRPEELQTMEMIRHALTELPANAPLREWLSETVQASLATVVGGFTGAPEALERHHAGADPFTAALPMIRNALLAWGAEKGAKFVAPALRAVPGTLQATTAPLGLAATRTPTLDYIIHGERKNRPEVSGGAVPRAVALATQISRRSRPPETGQNRSEI